eukprot:gene15486-21571_t
MASLKAENQRLRMAMAVGGTADMREEQMKTAHTPSHLRSAGTSQLEREVSTLRSELAQACMERKASEEKVAVVAEQLKILRADKRRCEDCVSGLVYELAKSRLEVDALLTKVLGGPEAMKAARMCRPSIVDSKVLAMSILSHMRDEPHRWSYDAETSPVAAQPMGQAARVSEPKAEASGVSEPKCEADGACKPKGAAAAAGYELKCGAAGGSEQKSVAALVSDPTCEVDGACKPKGDAAGVGSPPKCGAAGLTESKREADGACETKGHCNQSPSGPQPEDASMGEVEEPGTQDDEEEEEEGEEEAKCEVAGAREAKGHGYHSPYTLQPEDASKGKVEEPGTQAEDDEEEEDPKLTEGAVQEEKNSSGESEAADEISLTAAGLPPAANLPLFKNPTVTSGELKVYIAAAEDRPQLAVVVETAQKLFTSDGSVYGPLQPPALCKRPQDHSRPAEGEGGERHTVVVETAQKLFPSEEKVYSPLQPLASCKRPLSSPRLDHDLKRPHVL